MLQCEPCALTRDQASSSAVVKGRQGIGGEPWRPSPAPRDEEIAPAAENHINETDGDANLWGHANSCELQFAHVTRRRGNHTSGLLDRERIIEPSRDRRRRNRSIGSIQRKNPRPDAAMSPNPIKNATSPKLPAARNRLFVGPCGIGSGLSSSMMVLLLFGDYTLVPQCSQAAESSLATERFRSGASGRSALRGRSGTGLDDERLVDKEARPAD